MPKPLDLPLHYVSSRDLLEDTDYRMVAVLIGTHRAIDNWVGKLILNPDIGSNESKVSWYISFGMNYLLFWGNAPRWIKLKTLLDKNSDEEVTVSNILIREWE